MLLATLQLIADATAAAPAAGGSMDASSIGIMIASILGGLGLGGAGGAVIARKMTIANDPLNCREVKDLVTREEHDKDIREMRDLLRTSENRTHELIRASEGKTHHRIDDLAKQINHQTGLLEGIRDTLRERKTRP